METKRLETMSLKEGKGKMSEEILGIKGLLMDCLGSLKKKGSDLIETLSDLYSSLELGIEKSIFENMEEKELEKVANRISSSQVQEELEAYNIENSR